jgi:hypothetical protein
VRHPGLAAIAAIAVIALPSLALGAPHFVAERVVVVGHVDDGAWSDAATEARLDQKAELAAIVVGHRGARRVVLAPAAIAKVKLAGAVVRTEPLEGVHVQWSTVEPHGFRAHAAPNGATSEFYSNVSTEPTTFGKWLGYDHIDYFEHVARAWSADAIIPAVVQASEPDAQQVAGVGTIRYKAEVDLDGTTLASPGADATDTFGLLPSVHRVSVRLSDDFLGELSEYMLVPEVFGSAGGGRDHQTERFTGADCADVMVGAARRMGMRLAYTNVASLPDYTTTVAHATDLDDHGMPAAPITGVKPGDLIRIDYGGALRGHTPRAYDHVAALWQDRSDPAGPAKGGADGQLDGFDLVIHMGHPRLVIEPLSEQAPATIDVLRWKRSR